MKLAKIKELHASALQGIAMKAWRSNAGKFKVQGGEIAIPGIGDQDPPKWFTEALGEAAVVGVESAVNQAIQTAHDATRQCRTRALDIMETVLAKAQGAGEELVRIVEDGCGELRGDLQRYDVSPMIRESIADLARRVKPGAAGAAAVKADDLSKHYKSVDARGIGESRTLAMRKEIIQMAGAAELNAIGVGLDLERWSSTLETDESYRERLLEKLTNGPISTMRKTAKIEVMQEIVDYAEAFADALRRQV